MEDTLMSALKSLFTSYLTVRGRNMPKSLFYRQLDWIYQSRSTVNQAVCWFGHRNGMVKEYHLLFDNAPGIDTELLQHFQFGYSLDTRGLLHPNQMSGSVRLMDSTRVSAEDYKQFMETVALMHDEELLMQYVGMRSDQLGHTIPDRIIYRDGTERFLRNSKLVCEGCFRLNRS